MNTAMIYRRIGVTLSSYNGDVTRSNLLNHAPNAPSGPVVVL